MKKSEPAETSAANNPLPVALRNLEMQRGKRDLFKAAGAKQVRKLKDYWDQTIAKPVALSDAHTLLDDDLIGAFLLIDMMRICRPAVGPGGRGKLFSFPMTDADGQIVFPDYRSGAEREALVRQLRPRVLERLVDGTLVARGIISHDSDSRKPAPIEPSLWRFVTPDFENSMMMQSGNLVAWGVTVANARRPPSSVSRQPASDAALKKWFRRWKAENDNAGRIPSRDEDLEAARAEFGPAITRDRVRDVRAAIALGWRRGKGKPRKRP